MLLSFKGKLYRLLYVAVFLIFILSFLRIHSRIQTTLLGYEIGRLKEKESTLLKKRSRLVMELAKVSTYENLKKLSKNESTAIYIEKNNKRK